LLVDGNVFESALGLLVVFERLIGVLGRRLLMAYFFNLLKNEHLIPLSSGGHAFPLLRRPIVIWLRGSWASSPSLLRGYLLLIRVYLVLALLV
jgi:hypothetical protein